MLRIVTQARALTTLLPALLIACAATAPHALAGEFMIMPTIAFAHQNRSSPDPTLERQQYIADLFYSGDIGSFRLLGELQVDPGGYDMERLQAGWRVTPDISLWFGRYHNPIGYWNMEHHHGHYMETSAERPQIVEFEDEGGPLPIHLFGLLLQGMHPIGDASLQYDLGVASGPRVVDGEFGPVDVVRKPRFNKLALVARVAYRPDAAQDDQYGAFVARTKIPAEGLDFTEIQQDLAGIYLSRDIDRLRVFGEVFRINHRVLQGPGVVWPSYWAGYAQAEYKVIPGAWTAFARYEGISSRLSEDYTALFPRLSKQREIAGIRWDYYENQALKLELVRDVSVSGIATNGIELQWSAMFHFH